MAKEMKVELNFSFIFFSMSQQKRRLLNREFKLLRAAQFSSIADLFSFGKHLLSHSLFPSSYFFFFAVRKAAHSLFIIPFSLCVCDESSRCF